MIREQTLNTMVTQAMGEVEGVSDVAVNTQYDGETIAIGIDISVTPNINIPATTLAMQKRVRQQVVELSGIAVKDISITIVALKMPENLSDISVAEVVSKSAVQDATILASSLPTDDAGFGDEAQAERDLDEQAETDDAEDIAAEPEPEDTGEPEEIGEPEDAGEPEVTVEPEEADEPEEAYEPEETVDATEAAWDLGDEAEPTQENELSEEDDADTEPEAEEKPVAEHELDGMDWSFQDFADGEDDAKSDDDVK